MYSDPHEQEQDLQDQKRLLHQTAYADRWPSRSLKHLPSPKSHLALKKRRLHVHRAGSHYKRANFGTSAIFNSFLAALDWGGRTAPPRKH